MESELFWGSLCIDDWLKLSPWISFGPIYPLYKSMCWFQGPGLPHCHIFLNTCLLSLVPTYLDQDQKLSKWPKCSIWGPSTHSRVQVLNLRLKWFLRDVLSTFMKSVLSQKVPPFFLLITLSVELKLSALKKEAPQSCYFLASTVIWRLHITYVQSYLPTLLVVTRGSYFSWKNLFIFV